MNGDGQLDDDMLVTTKNTAVAITDALSSDKVKPMAGKKIDVFVQAFHGTYATPDEAMRSVEYDPNNWSTLLTVDVPATTP